MSAEGLDVPAEVAVVALRLRCTAARVSASLLSSSDFTDPDLAAIFGLQAELAVAGVDPQGEAVLTAGLRPRPDLPAGLPSRLAPLLASLAASTVTPESEGWYSRIVAEDATRRATEAAGTLLAQAAASEPAGTLPDRLDRCAAHLSGLAARLREPA